MLVVVRTGYMLSLERHAMGSKKDVGTTEHFMVAMVERLANVSYHSSTFYYCESYFQVMPRSPDTNRIAEVLVP